MQAVHKVAIGVVVVALLAASLLVVVQPAFATTTITSDPDNYEQFLSVPNEAGQLPCAAFDVQGWGAKWLNLDDFPACNAYLPDVTVSCFKDEAGWSDVDVHDLAYHPMEEFESGPVLTFTSSQDGVCAIFPDEPPFSAEFALLLFGLLSDSLYMEPPADVSAADLPIVVYNVSDPDSPLIGTGELPIFVIATSQPSRIQWDKLAEGLYMVILPSDVEYGELPERLFGGQTEFDVYPEGVYTLPDDPALVEFFPLP